MKFIYLLSVVALSFIFGCTSKEEKTSETKTVETVKVIEKEAPAEDETATKIKVDSEGGSVKTKDVEIEINE